MVQGFPGGKVVKSLPANAGDTGSIPGSGRSPGREDGNPLQYSCLENSHKRRGLVGSSLGGSTQLDTPEQACSSDPVDRNRCSHWIHFLVREPRSHKSHSLAKNQKSFLDSSLVDQWLRLHAPNAGGTGSFPGWGIKISHAARFSLKKKFFFKHKLSQTQHSCVHHCCFRVSEYKVKVKCGGWCAAALPHLIWTEGIRPSSPTGSRADKCNYVCDMLGTCPLCAQPVGTGE